MKKSLRIKSFIDETIKVGDRVLLIDGSSLSYLSEEDFPKFQEEVYIVFGYKEITGTDLKLKDIVAEVTSIGISNYVLPSSGYDTAYLQDIIVKIGKGYFRTASKLVKKV